MIKQRLIVYIFILGLFLPLSYVSAGIILSPYQYAWSDQVGYINFAPANGGVIVNDASLSGHAWSENTGYINFAPANGGVFNDGAGNLSGSAWGEGLGYIDFENVFIDPATGKFSGTATGSGIGTLTFDCGFCDVRTDWNIRSTTTTSGSRPKLPEVKKVSDDGTVPSILLEPTLDSFKDASIINGDNLSASLIGGTENAFGVDSKDAESTNKNKILSFILDIPLVMWILVLSFILFIIKWLKF